MKRILLTAAGGAPSINFARSLRDSKEEYFILGVDSSPYTIHRAEADAKELCPPAKEADYIPYLNFLIEKYDIDFLHAQPDAEVGVISENREKIECKTCLPSARSVRILRNKFESYRIWKEKGVPVPHTILISTEQDLADSFARFGENIWIREIEGAAGKGSLSSPTFDEALLQIRRVNGWGRYTAAEKLKKSTVTWMAIFRGGELVVAQTRERLYWEAANRAQSGVTGITGTGRTVSNALVNETALFAIRSIDENPHGIFSVDMTYGPDDKPRLTEINIGKFFTTHHFFTRAGVNFPEIYLRVGFDEPVEFCGEINPITDGWNWIRGMDVEPVLIHDEEIRSLQSAFEEQRRSVHAQMNHER